MAGYDTGGNPAGGVPGAGDYRNQRSGDGVRARRMVVIGQRGGQLKIYKAALPGLGWLATIARATLPVRFREQAITGISVPAMTFATGGRLFLLQQGGQLRAIKDGVLLPGVWVL